MKTISLRFEDFESAFIIGSPDSRYFVSTETGEVIHTSHFDDETVRKRILDKVSAPGWLEIPRPTEADARAEIDAFIASEGRDGEIGQALTAGLSDKKPFVGFNKALGKFPDARRRWSEARMAAIHRRLLAFTTQHELIIDDPAFAAIASTSGR